MLDHILSDGFTTLLLRAIPVIAICFICAFVAQKFDKREDRRKEEHAKELAKIEIEKEMRKEKERAKIEAEYPTVMSEARICERCGAPLKDNICEYCGSRYDIMRTKAK